MPPRLKNRFRAICLLPLSLFLCALRVDAQQMPMAPPNSNASPSPTPAVFSPQTLAELKRLQQVALSSDYAYKQVAHLANNIGPRLSGSAQAAKSVQYVASELKALGCEVQLERVMAPHWVRGEETAALVQFPGQAENTTQKIVLCALGASVATPADGITANVVVATKSRARLYCSIIRSINKWPRKVVVAKHTAKQLFIAAMVEARLRDRALSRA